MGANNVDYSTITVESTVKSLAQECDPVMPPRAKGARITLEQANIRFREDGTDPTASEGELLFVGDVWNYPSWEVPGQNWKSVLQSLKIIQAAASTTGILKIHWYD